MTARGTLRKDTVLDAALRVVDRRGVRGLSIRLLAAEVGCAPMSLYTHFATKEQLLDFTFERMLRRVFDVAAAPTWQQELENACRHARAVILEHPRWIELATRNYVPTWTLGVYDRLLGLLAKDGVADDVPLLAFSSLMTFTFGSVLVERMMGGQPPVPQRHLALVKSALAEGDGPTYPRVERLVGRFEEWSFDRVFDAGLHSLVRCIELDMQRSAPHMHA